MRMKYIMMDNLGMFSDGTGFFIFPEFEEHLSVANKMGGKEHVVGAGFVSIKSIDNKVKIQCYGDSHSLKICVGEKDSRIIQMYLEG